MSKLFLIVALLALPGVAQTPELEALRRYEGVMERLPETKEALTRKERSELFRRVSLHPVTDLNNLGVYDPQGFIGFCFGRAMGVQLTARLMGLKEGSLRKLFIIGDLRSGTEPEWRFHVTTLVRGQEDGRWYAIDPIMTAPIAPGGPIPIEQWVAIVRKVWDKQHAAKLYLTSPHTIMPDVTLDPNGTTGDAILELGFDPDRKSGFQKAQVATVDLWVTDARAEESYLMSVKEPESTRFKFDGLVIDGQTIDYREYFIKLLGDLSGEDPLATLKKVSLNFPGPIKPGCQKSFSQVSGPGANLASPRLHQFFGGGAQ